MDIFERLNCYYENFNGEKGIIGKSWLKVPLYYIAVKKSEYPKIIFQYSIHAREYITCYLALKQIDRFLEFGKNGTAYFLPMLNPDGVKIALEENPLYKANFNRVDLNVNFDARWGTGIKNVNNPATENYIGKSPFSEPETRALRDFTLKICPNMTVSYHSKGEEIYWEFHQEEKCKKRDFAFAMAVSRLTGYSVKETPNSAGGYKDWCVEKLKIPALTIEVGDDRLVHPIGEEQLDKIYKKNEKVVEYLTENFGELWKLNL